MDFIQQAANDYVAHYSDATPAYLRPMYEQTLLSHPHAHLQSNWNQGGFLSFFSKLMAPQTILEIGTFTGFSTLCLAEGLTATGTLDTIELRAEDANAARVHFNASAKGQQIISHIGDAKNILPTLHKQWDLVFIDADKTGYIEYVNLVLPMLSDKGVIIADNVLFHGQVFEEQITGKNALAIHAFNEYILAHKGIEKIMLTVRDGLTLIRKK
ncbi:MAG: O-methyltransferase [Chitinophagaceae bacterium]|jgi:caffeoyl-CoA O-methyltransferase|nr:O-methyltransferase [Chitinophagaceae bacterium]MCF8421707.1 O-methyltransferase [Chitinophagaceae bacterium]